MSLADPIGWGGSLLVSATSGAIAEAANDLATNPVLFAEKIGNTGIAIQQFGDSHQRYGIDRVFAGKTAVEHSAFHLNWWGARRS